MIASMVRATGVLLILAGGGLYGAPAANEVLQCANAPNPATAIRDCTAAIASGGLSDADLASVLGWRCRAYANKHDYARALPDCERAVRLAPEAALYVYRRGWVRLYSGNLDGAMLDFDQALLLDPNFAAAYNGRATVYARRAEAASNSAVSDEQYDQAIRNLGEALRLKPDGATYFKRGWCNFQKHAYDPAKQDFDEAIRLRSGAGAYYYRGWCYFYYAHYSRAIADFDQVIRLDPKFAGAYRSLALAHEQQREYDLAIQDYTHELRLAPDAGGYSGRGWAYYQKGAYALALWDFARASWHVWAPLVLVAGLIYVLWRRRKRQGALAAAESTDGGDVPPPADEVELTIEGPEPEPARDTSEPTDLDALIRTGLRDRIAIGMAEGSLREAAIPFFVMDQNVWARQESGNFMAWWNIRVPHEREAEAREIIRAVEEMK